MGEKKETDLFFIVFCDHDPSINSSNRCFSMLVSPIVFAQQGKDRFISSPVWFFF